MYGQLLGCPCSYRPLLFFCFGSNRAWRLVGGMRGSQDGLAIRQRNDCSWISERDIHPALRAVPESTLSPQTPNALDLLSAPSVPPPSPP